MARFLRSPWLAALLLVLSPGATGVVLPLLHPCPVEQGGAHGEHGSQHAPASSDAGHEGGCTCVGSCHVPALVTTPRVATRPVAATAALDGRPPARPRSVSTVPDRPSDLLPPPTAPPLS